MGLVFASYFHIKLRNSGINSLSFHLTSIFINKHSLAKF